jgi:acid phosphatase
MRVAVKYIVAILILVGVLVLGGRFVTQQRELEIEAHEQLDAVLWMQTAAERRALSLQTYQLAGRMLDGALEDPTWTAAVEQEGDFSELPPAVILDVDETVLDNSAYQARLIARNTQFETESWHQWCREVKALAVPGAVEFTQYAGEQGVTVFYLTNRRHAVEEATRENLEQLGFYLDEDKDTLFTRAEKEEWDASDKSPRRAEVASSYRILLLIGDDLNDFVSGTRESLAGRESLVNEYGSYWGTRWILLPNPEYGGWEGALTGFDYQLSDDERLWVKRDVLRLH